ncbi:CI repressor [Pantoea agglomerans]|uniref:phage repressor protein CI n=1 Tax=Enterobacter agglomerans TaxID=549 RepID=UPI0013C0D3CA|nr:phage repressor protein CI [Pantoea agglomerans]NEH19267.1 CI repressor [Pantoea agglomerans]
MKLDELEGGKAVLQRMLDAYGFTLQKQLGDLHELSSGTISTWIRRDYFPGDVVVACALDTGVSLRWLATGKGNKYDTDSSKGRMQTLTRFDISAGNLIENDKWVVDKALLTEAITSPNYICKGLDSWIVDFDSTSISNGRWLLSIDGDHDIYDVARIPGNKIKVSNSGADFQCAVDEVNCIGQVHVTLSKVD